MKLFLFTTLLLILTWLKSQHYATLVYKSPSNDTLITDDLTLDYAIIKKTDSLIGIEPLNGLNEGIEIRIWVSSFAMPKELIRVISNGTTVDGTFSRIFYDSDTTQNDALLPFTSVISKIVLDSIVTKKLVLKTSISQFNKYLGSLNIQSIPNQSQTGVLNGFLCSHCLIYTIEFSSKNFYKMVSYISPDIFIREKNNRVINDLINLIPNYFRVE